MNVAARSNIAKAEQGAAKTVGIVGAAVLCCALVGFVYFGLYAKNDGLSPWLNFASITLFFSGLAFFGLCMVKLAVVAHQCAALSEKLRNEHPNEPWMWNPKWASGRIVYSARGSSVVAWVIGLVWWALVLPGVLLSLKSSTSKEIIICLLGLIVGVILVVFAVLLSVRARKYGNSIFLSRSLPARIGGGLTGAIHVDRSEKLPGHVILRLVCIRREARRSGNGFRESVCWENEKRLETTLRADPARDIPVNFRVPHDAKPTDHSDSQNQIFWRLVASAAAPGANYSAEFEVPVFAADASTLADAPHDENQSHWRAETAPTRIEDMGITVFVFPDGGRQFHFGLARDPLSALCLSVPAAILLAIGFQFLFSRLAIASPIPFTMGLLLTIVAIPHWLRTTTVTVRRNSMQIEDRLGPFHRDRTIETCNIEKIVARIAMQGFTRPIYRLVVFANRGGVRALTPLIRSKHDAELLAAEMMTAMGKIAASVSAPGPG